MGTDIKQFAAGSCYSYIVSSGGEAVIIDPHISLGDEYSRYIAARMLKLKYIVDTHTHADHFSLAAILKKKHGAPVLMHEKAVSQVADRRLKDSDTIGIGALELKAIYSPGHTDDMVNISAPGAVFTADTLLIGSIGRTDFQNGSPESMFDTLQALKALPDGTVVYPGHDYNGRKRSSVGKEKSANPFMAGADKAKFVGLMRAKTLKKPFNMDNIVRANQSGQALALGMISPKDALALAAADAGVKFLDVRSPSEYAEEHIKDSVNMPIGGLSASLEDLAGKASGYIVLCRTGNRSAMAADMLIQSGIRSVQVLDGGMERWKKDRLPFIRGEKTMSLERQVRIAAGALVLAGLLLSWFVNPWFAGISLFVACGLIFAGITDSCMMGMLLMKLPYNRKSFAAKSGGGTCSMS